MSGHTLAVTPPAVCPLCDGPCQDPIRPRGRPISPTVTPEHSASVAAVLDPTEPDEPARRRGRRAHEPSEDRAHRPSEDR